MEVRILGAHNTESGTSRLAGVLIDRVVALDAGSITSSLSINEQIKLEAVLLTHQHYDHIRDIPGLGMNLYLNRKTIPVCALPETLDMLSAYVLNGQVYPQFTHRPADNPNLVFKPVRPGEGFNIGTYQILPVTMPHSVPSVGYLITGIEKLSMFYTGDTGCGFASRIESLEPDILIVEVTAPSRFGDSDWSNKHLTPAFLEQELILFRTAADYIPRIICVHMYEALEEEIRTELSEVAARLEADITPAYEGMILTVQ
ncbi:MAG: MBL fold metallo-hydrolase [Dehalococcoidales bacterium]|nr:MBL fold metallo-hydrolase [Dehalococcoidales bacterium]